ncbi:hypothetical protein C0993_009132 [Termitomyces sp. T159_Od127]|nr:hypothetical protein C0993_009132 [Termitomyces sp. T159_Od127]
MENNQYKPYPGPTPNYGGYEGFVPEQPAPPPAYYRKSPHEGDRFKPKHRINDPIFLIFFVLQLLGYTALSGIVLNSWSSSNGFGGGLGQSGGQSGTAITVNRSTVYLLLLVTAAALLLSTLYLMLTRAFTRIIMHITLVLTIMLNISRIPLASLLLQVVMDVAKLHISVYLVAFVALLLQAALAVWYVFTAIATCSSGKVAGLIFYETFSFLWTSQVVKNVAVATLAGGPFGAWYYFGPRGMGEMPSHPTISAFGRASTLSLGSIAFGSLIVTLLELVKMLLNMIRNNANADGHPLYGKPYIAAAKDTWRLFKDRGIDALVNDSLVGMSMPLVSNPS